jgi:hypothetical protein
VRRFPLAFLLVGLMSVLAAGGAVLGVFQAPTGADLSVHNAAGETLEATRIVGSYTTSREPDTTISFVFTAPNHVLIKALAHTGKVEARENVTTQASGVLSPLRHLLSINAFSVHGSYYQYTEPASKVLRPSLRSEVSGTYTWRVELEGGYVVGIFLHFDAKVESQHVTETEGFRLSRIDGWIRPR